MALIIQIPGGEVVEQERVSFHDEAIAGLFAVQRRMLACDFQAVIQLSGDLVSLHFQLQRVPLFGIQFALGFGQGYWPGLGVFLVPVGSQDHTVLIDHHTEQMPPGMIQAQVKELRILKLKRTAEHGIAVGQFPGQNGRVFVGGQFLANEHIFLDLPFPFIDGPLFSEFVVIECLALAGLPDLDQHGFEIRVLFRWQECRNLKSQHEAETGGWLEHIESFLKPEIWDRTW